MSTTRGRARWLVATLIAVTVVLAGGLGLTRAYADYSDNLRDHVVSVDIEGGDYDKGSETVTVRPGTNLALTLNFAENRDKQFHRENSLSYPLPQGFDYGTQSGTFLLNIDDEGQQVSKNVPYTIQNGVLTVTWPTDDPDFTKVFNDVSNAKFHITFNAIYENAEGPVDFGNGVTKTFKLDSSHDVDVQKDGYVGQDGKIHYTVRVTSTGRNDNVRVTDAISGSALTYDEGSFAISGNSTTPTGGTSGNGFDITLPHMESGEVTTITYTASIDYSKITNGGDQGQTENGVSVTTPDKSNPKTSNKSFEHQIQTSDVINKSGQAADQGNGDGTRDVTWTIDANSQHHLPLAGQSITDTIDAGSRDKMHYSGDGIQVEVYEAGSSTPKETRTLTWAQLGVDPSQASAWTYQVPKNDGNYEYKVTYTTRVDMRGQIQSRTVKNGASVSGGPSANGGVDVPSDFTFDAHKTVKSFDAQKATWQITANVPKDGYSSFVVTDTLPTTYLNGKNVYDQLVDGSIQVEGLQGGESYTVDSSDPSKAVLTFYQDQSHTKPGLGASDAERTITVTLATKFDVEWLAAVRGGTAGDWQKTHTNNASITANGVTKNPSASVNPPLDESIKKTGAAAGEANIDGVSLPVYRYELQLTGVPDADLDIVDTFDEDLTYYNPSAYQDWSKSDANGVYGGNQYYQGNGGPNPAAFSATDNSISIHVPQASLPKDSSGAPYSHYRIVYYLVAKDATALADLKQRANTNNGTVALNNTAMWGTQRGDAQVSYTYDLLDKQLTKEPTSDDRQASYSITINREGLDINPDGDVLTLTDVMTNQDLDVSSVKVSALDGKPLSDDQIHYDYDHATGTLTLTFPDRRALQLTYNTTVTGTGDVTYTNTASLRGQSKGVSKTAHLSHGGGGTASTVSIKLLKHEKGDLNKPLSGATFALYEAASKDDPSFDHSVRVKDKDGQDVSFTSGDDGIVQVKGGQKTLGWTIEEGRAYYLVETQAPDGYQLDAKPIEFVITDNPSGDGQFTSGFTIDFANEKAQQPAGPALPGLGGPGTVAFYVVGGVLVAAGGYGLLRRRFSGRGE